MSETTDDNDIENDISYNDDSCNENSFASHKTGSSDDVDFSLPLDEILLAMNQSLCRKLDVLESKVDGLDRFCHVLEHKLETVVQAIKDKNITSECSSDLIQAGNGKSANPSSSTCVKSVLKTLGSKGTPISLNSEDDFPDGTWLGDENNHKMRVRCHVTPVELFHINSTCPTAEKMALTLMDYLFDRETQACSNISGQGRHKKFQLDPLKIYGIKCHLVHKFKTKDKDWQRIKQNIDSKCRTAFRRKSKGMPLMIKSFRNKVLSNDVEIENSDFQVSSSDDIDGLIEVSTDPSSDIIQTLSAAPQVLTLHPGSLTISNDFAAMMDGAQVIQTSGGAIQVLQATAEQLVEMEQAHQIQILTDGQVITADDIIKEVQQNILTDATDENMAADDASLNC